jgi:hypothetical protein
MPKRAVRLFPVDIDHLESREIVDGSAVRERVLTRDETTGATTRFVALPAGSTWPAERLEHWTELWLWSGVARLGEHALPRGTYLSMASGEIRAALHGLSDALVVEFQAPDSSRMDKASVFLLPEDIARLAWVRPAGAPDGLREKVLAAGEGGSATRLLEALPYVATDAVVHEHHEEVIVLSGSFRIGEEFHVTRTYTCKGPGVWHGPFMTSEGFLCLEVRNYLQA